MGYVLQVSFSAIENVPPNPHYRTAYKAFNCLSTAVSLLNKSFMGCSTGCMRCALDCLNRRIKQYDVVAVVVPLISPSFHGILR